MNQIISERQTRIRKQQRNKAIMDALATAGMFMIVGFLAVIVIQDYIEARNMLEAAKAGL